METTSHSLPFLAVLVSIKDAAYNTQVFRKPTNTGVLMNFSSMAPLKWKKALTKCFLNRALRLSSSLEYFTSEVDIIKTKLKANGYPDRFVKSICDEYIQQHGINADSFDLKNTCNSGRRVKDSNDGYLTIPYVGKPSLQLQHRIGKEMKDCGISILPSYTTTKVGSYFNLKPSCPQLFQSNVVYKFTCSCDKSATYIGETRRQLFRRVEDHIGKDKNSAVFDHMYSCQECQSTSDIHKRFQIIQKCGRNNILSFEALLISKFRPKLNTQLGPGRGTMISLSLY